MYISCRYDKRVGRKPWPNKNVGELPKIVNKLRAFAEAIICKLKSKNRKTGYNFFIGLLKLFSDLYNLLFSNWFYIFKIKFDSKKSKSKVQNPPPREMCPYSEFFWSVFSPNAGIYGPEKLWVWRLFTKTEQKQNNNDCSSEIKSIRI